jgi:hypothetical protein
MSLMFVAALFMAQAPAATPPAAPAPAAKPAKPKQVCEMIEVTGSRSKKRVCRDDSGVLDLGPGVSRMGAQGRINQQGGATPGGPPGS